MNTHISELHILLVDDSEEDILLFKTLVNKTNKKYNLSVSFDVIMKGEHVMSALKKHNYQLILLDQKMPDKNGLEIFQDIKHFQIQSHCKRPVVSYSNCDLDEFVKQCLDTGIDQVRTKYMEPQTFKELIDYCMLQQHQ